MKSKIALKLAMAIALVSLVVLLSSCDRDADIVSHNLSNAADNFEIHRRIVFYNGITGGYMLVIEGVCSINHINGNKPNNSKRIPSVMDKLEVVCKVDKSEYKKHFLGLSDNVTYFVEQLEPKKTSRFHYRVTFKPQSIIPDIDFRGGTK